VAVSARAAGNTIEMTGTNKTAATITIVLKVTESNAASSQVLSVTETIPPGMQKTLACVTNTKAGVFNCAYTYRYALGNASAKHDDSYVYQLPYATGQWHKVDQSFGGSFSHTGSLYYAVDFTMPEGTPVLAAREGFVVMTESSQREGGPERSFRDKANCVLIEHTDGTIGAYMHLKQNGVLVKTGDIVGRGQVIGYSGATGWATGPHLHFSVHRLFGDDDLGESAPFKFESNQGVVERPVVGMIYTHEN
jgi:murein DD-endopeptidase MepM/ murein hydrolase activator NlpD